MIVISDDLKKTKQPSDREGDGGDVAVTLSNKSASFASFLVIPAREILVDISRVPK